MDIIQATPVILCGGSGTRLWPLSRTGFPKQFLCLKEGNDSLFQQAVQRLVGLGNEQIQIAAPLIVSGEDHRFLASEQIREAGIALGALLLEPAGRNTAPALTLAALAATKDGQDPVLVVTPADHDVTNNVAFATALQQAIQTAADGPIVILGVKPTQPETGYGYIQAALLPGNVSHIVQRFVEKPNLATAKQCLQEGDYFWNAGIFVLKANVWLKALQQFRPDILQATQAAWINKTQDGAFVRPGKTEFTAIPAESVDYAVMQHCPGSSFAINMVPLDAGWSDLGAWDAVWNVHSKDAQGNVHLGDVLAHISSNTLVHATSRLVSLVGVQDLVVVETPDAVLVASKNYSQNVKDIVNQLQAKNREEHTLHRKMHRPWGWYDSIDEGIGFKVKRIQVKPGASLSLQKHYHRAEHWIVVKGTAIVTKGEEEILLTENQSTYIPLGIKHRLENSGKIDLELIEVQSGSYLGEDDIERFDDAYGRT